MEVVKTNIFDDVSNTSPPQAEPQSIDVPNINNENVNNSVNIEDTDVSEVSNGNEEPVVLNTTICKSLDVSKTSSDSEHIVQNILFDIKSDEFMSTNLVDETCLNFNVKSYNSDDKNIEPCLSLSTNIFNTFNESQVPSSSDEATYSLINNTNNKKRSFSIDEINKDDETSQISQGLSTYSNDYTCFLSEQTDAINNLTPFKRSNSYYFDSPIKKLCANKPSSEGINSQANGTFYENDSKMFNGFTGIQNNLEVDCIKDRYDGSDSGFGSELAEDKNSVGLGVLNSYKNDFTLNQESSFEDLQRTSNEFLSAMEVLKPKFSDSVLDTASSIEVSNNYGIVKGILKRNQPIDYDILASDKVDTVKKRKNINFANVTVFYFPRVQGFTCVPSQVMIFK